MGAALAPVIFLDPIRANCGCNPLRCEGHQPTPTHADPPARLPTPGTPRPAAAPTPPASNAPARR